MLPRIMLQSPRTIKEFTKQHTCARVRLFEYIARKRGHSLVMEGDRMGLAPSSDAKGKEQSQREERSSVLHVEGDKSRAA